MGSIFLSLDYVVNLLWWSAASNKFQEPAVPWIGLFLRLQKNNAGAKLIAKWNIFKNLTVKTPKNIILLF